MLYVLDMILNSYSIIFSLSLVIRIVVAVLIYQDAKKIGMEPEGYTFLACCCGWLCGGIVYVVARSSFDSPNRHFEGENQTYSNNTQYYGQPQPSTQNYRDTNPSESDYSQYNKNAYSSVNQSNLGYNSDFQDTPQKTSKTCLNCGSVVPKDVNFCPSCGSQEFQF